ncbi:DUF6268 family outer membrane beta-barrel protein [Flavobacterium sp. ov086]|jgi:hypothetical protein|uniref:DUF6268 family outer membrane beta-barrel protein n=1 Tax=Flavobacterium sp. ov086 TaxID=1761785 RepID=UPI000B6247B9|nr:DUF6268 family outer membrane beta-barrel protein [Flavobacterium sp. ov086]SNR76871.1 hypothetical protein SAMN04487979_12055 [Flavobacterium sp. ov086]
MKILKKTLFFCCVLLPSLACFSQTQSDSIKKKVIAYAADKFPITRALNVEFTHVAPYNFTPEMGNTKLPQSRVDGLNQAKISANYNFIKTRKWMLGATLGYKYLSSESLLTSPTTAEKTAVEQDFHYQFSALNFVYFTKLFKKTTFFSSTVMVDGSEQHFERVKAIFTGTMVLTSNERTKLSVGILINIDPSAQSPFIPTVSYEHHFNNGLILDINLPKSMMLRKNVFENGRISLGTELDQTNFYLYNIDGTSKKYEFRQLDINSGLLYEHMIANYFLLSAKTGIRLSPNGRIFEKSGSYADPVFEVKNDPSFYMNFGVSFNPFAKYKKR